MNNVVLYPCTAVGHLTPMMELAKVFLERGYTVSVALLDDPLTPPVMSSAIERAVASHPSVSFHWLRAAATSPCFAQASDGEHYLVRYFSLIRHNNEQFRDLLCSKLVPQPVHVVVIDTFCLHALDVPKELGVPAYGFFPSSAGALAIHLQLPSIQAKSRASFSELVTAKEVEAKVRLVMESEALSKLRARVTAHMAAAALAWAHGGSSRAAFARFLSYVDIRRRR